jgi:uncharacterized protein (DUF4415 family)
MPKLKPGTIMPTPEEDARIQAGIKADPEAYSLSDKEWEQVKPLARIGRPKAEVTKERITIRLSRDVVKQFRALRQFISEHPLRD